MASHGKSLPSRSGLRTWWRTLPFGVRGLIGLTVAACAYCVTEALLASPRWGPRFRTRGSALAILQSVESAARLFRLEHGHFPHALAELRSTSSVLAEPYLAVIPTDPWGRPVRYELSANGEHFELCSDGEDDLAGTEDDVVWPRRERQSP
jgi:hypothetical protein